MTRKTFVRSALAAIAVLYLVLHAMPHTLHAAEFPATSIVEVSN